MIIRRTILVISAIAVVLLGLEHVGVYRFVPEGDVRFEAEVTQNPNRLLLSNDAGALKGWVHLVVDAPNSEPLSLRAMNWPGDAPGISVRRLLGDRYEIAISKQPVPPVGVPFDWPSGVPLELGIDSKVGGAITVADWAVFNSRQEADTKAKVRQRFLWTRFSWGLLGAALLGAALTALAEKDERQNADPARTLIKTIVVSIEGKSRADTRKIRRFLRKILVDGMPITEAVGSSGYDYADKRKWGPFLLRSKELFNDRAGRVQKDLDNAVKSLTL